MATEISNWFLRKQIETRATLRRKITELWKDESGAGTVEYAMIIAVVVVMIIAATAVMDTPVRDFFEGVIDKITQQSGV